MIGQWFRAVAGAGAGAGAGMSLQWGGDPSLEDDEISLSLLQGAWFPGVPRIQGAGALTPPQTSQPSLEEEEG